MTVRELIQNLLLNSLEQKDMDREVVFCNSFNTWDEIDIEIADVGGICLLKSKERGK